MYILRYYIKSKYNNYVRCIEKTFNDYILLVNYIKVSKIKDYEIFINYENDNSLKGIKK